MARPSSTAALVARGVAFQARHPLHGRLVSAEAARLAERFVREAGLSIRRGDSRLDRTLVALQERLTVPGLTLQYVLRKARIESIVRAAIAGGYSQLVMIGAGFDSLAVRLAPEMKGLRAIEVDRAATQAIKRRALVESHPVAFVSADLADETLSERLRACNAFDAARRTLFVAEAVFLYLTAGEVLATLRDIRESSPGARLVFTFFGARPGSRPNFRDATFLADLWLRWKGEPIRWAIDPEAVASFVEPEGFRLIELVRDTEYHRGFPAARGEHIAVVEAR